MNGQFTNTINIIMNISVSDLSHSETRLSMYLDTFELHVYNRSEVYTRLEKLFGLDLLISPQPEEKG